MTNVILAIAFIIYLLSAKDMIKILKKFFLNTGEMSRFAGRYFREVLLPPYEFQELLKQLLEINHLRW
jgi:spore maturation protein CgeB